MKALFTTILITIILLGNVFAQKFDPDNYQPLESKGSIPKIFTELAIDKFKDDKSDIDNSDKRKVKKAKEDFLLESNFMLDRVLISGKIVFNNDLCQYIKNIADYLLEDEPELRSHLDFFITKSPTVNAFVTDNGSVFINIGLIAQCENEAQLAFVVAHEIIHYVKKHGINLFLEKKGLKNVENSKNELAVNDKYFSEHYRSREMEEEADELGLTKFYGKSNYTLDAIQGAFDVLQYAYLPLDEIEFDKGFLETDHITIPENYLLEELTQIKGDDNYDDSKSTHPSIKKRREYLAEKIENLDNDGKLAFVQPKEDFDNIKNISRFELIRQQVRNGDYGNAFYNSYVMLQEYPESKFLNTSIASCLYGITKYKKADKLSYVLRDTDDIEGQSQQVFHLFRQFSLKELNVISLEYCWKLKTKYPDNKYISKITDDLFRMLVFHNEFKMSDFSMKTREAVSIETKEKHKKEGKKKLSKYDKIKMQKESVDTTDRVKDDVPVRYAFVNLLKDPFFFDTFDELIFEKESIEKENERFQELSRAQRKKEYKELIKKERERKIYGKSIGADKVLVLDPMYIKIDQRKKDAQRHVDSEATLTRLRDDIIGLAKKADLDVDLLSIKKISSSSQVDKFNDITALQSWFYERLDHQNVEIVPSEYQYIQDITKQYGTSYINWTGIITVHEKKTGAGWLFVGCIFVPYILPYAVYYLVKPIKKTYYYNVMYDIETGENKLATGLTLDSKDRKDIIHSRMYDTFNQMKNKKVKK